MLYRRLIYIILFLIFNVSKGYSQNNNYIDNNFNVLNKDKLYIFISFSMPNNLIKDYFIESKNIKKNDNIDIIFVLKGFYKNSFKETVNKISDIIQNDNNENLGIIVDPELYKKYDIKVVPSFVQEYNGYHDKIIGNITIKYVLNKFMGTLYE